MDFGPLGCVLSVPLRFVVDVVRFMVELQVLEQKEQHMMMQQPNFALSRTNVFKFASQMVPRCSGPLGLSWIPVKVRKIHRTGQQRILCLIGRTARSSV